MSEDKLAIAPRGDIVDLSPAETRRKLTAIANFQAIVRKELKEGHDYGIIPGTGNKPTLLKPGAEKLAKLLNCFDDYEIVDRVENWDKPLFRFLVRCTLSDMASGTKISSGLGECNSYESKYRFRWVGEDQVPFGVDKAELKSRGGRKTFFEFDFAIEKRETTGKYGKSAEYWDTFDKAIKAGTARKVERETKAKKKYWGYELDTDTTLYQVENQDIFDQVNTILKMAKKRALVDAALSAGRLSDLFTQDLDDLVETAPASQSAPEQVPGPSPQAATPPPAKAPEAQVQKESFPADTDGLTKSGIILGTKKQLADISASIEALHKFGKRDETIWKGIYAKVGKVHGHSFVEISELSNIEAETVLAYLKDWAKDIRIKDGEKEF